MPGIRLRALRLLPSPSDEKHAARRYDTLSWDPVHRTQYD